MFALAASLITVLQGISVNLTAASPNYPALIEQASSNKRALLDQYCVTCHNESLRTAGLTLDTVDPNNVSQNTELWEKVVLKLRSGMMPPPSRPRPDKATYETLASSLEKALDQAFAMNPNPGRNDSLRRLNGTEYENVIRDLLDLEINVATLLPADDSSAGFDNVGLGGLDPGRMERYLSVASKVSRLAVGAAVRSPVAETFIVPSDLNQNDHIEGLPFGTRGGTSFRYYFPVSGDYEIKLELGKSWNSNRIGGLRNPHNLVVTLDGEPVQTLTVEPRPRRDPATDQNQYENTNRPADADLMARIPITAGPRVVGVAFESQGSELTERRRQPFLKVHITVGGDQRTQPNLYSVTITGPFNPTGPGDTPSRRRIFTCQPTDSSEEPACAEDILLNLSRRAYRRPTTDTDLSTLLSFYRQGRATGTFETGIEMALRRMLVSPEFLFRIERDPENISSDAAYFISDIELASRLSFLLWSSIPDDELLDIASRKSLKDPEILEQQVRRMLNDPRAEALVTNFAAQWLYLRNLPAVSPDFIAFPDFDETLRRSLRQETNLFFKSIIREDRSVLDLLNADYTFLNERLAKHYGIPNIYGSHFRRVNLPQDSARGGLLGQGSILAVTSYATRTSPVVRGKWILENLLGTPPPPPPVNVPPLSEEASDAVLSMRERMVEHRRNPVCAACHAIMDPIGLSLENFDAIGRWRDRTEGFESLDVAGSFPDGTTFDGAAGLKRNLLSRSDQFVRTLAEKLLIYGLGRAVEHYDMPAVRAIEREAADKNYRFSELILGVVRSTPFQMRRGPES
jgi:hypothetical protein